MVLNKADLPPVTDLNRVRSRYRDDCPAISISALASEDMERLKEWLTGLVLRHPVESLGSAVIPNLRHKTHFQAAANYLEAARDALAQGSSPELTTIEVRGARMELNAILGCDGSEEVLDRIFSRFCIGK
jgi:tRNA modification GTPase